MFLFFYDTLGSIELFTWLMFSGGSVHARLYFGAVNLFSFFALDYISFISMVLTSFVTNIALA